MLGVSAFHVDSLRLQGQGLSHNHPGSCDRSPQPSNGRRWLHAPEQFILGEGVLEGLQVRLGRTDKETSTGSDRKLALCPRWAVVTLPRVAISQQNLPKLKGEIGKSFKGSF